MNLVWVGIVVVLVAGAAITAMLLVRRRAPEGSHFKDGDRASGVFGVLATGFAVLLGFVVFLSFASYDLTRSGAEDEARIVAQQFETAQFLPASASGRLSEELLCYARSIARTEWPRLQSGTGGAAATNPWGVAMFTTIEATEPTTASQEAAFGKWLDQTSDRESAREDRTHGSDGVIPTTLWIVLFLTAGVIFLYMLFFADSAEGVVTQAMLMGGVAVMITSTLLLLWFLDTPYRDGIGGLKPEAMERTIALIENEGAQAAGLDLTPPCDQSGAPRDR